MEKRDAGRATGVARERGAPSSRAKILEVAEGLFARRGYAGVGMREVAEAAGLGKSSLFHYFRSKVQLYLAVQERVLRRIEGQVAPALAVAGDAAARLDACLDALVDVLAEHPTTARLLLRGLFEDEDFDAEAWPEGQAAAARLEALLAGIRALLRDGARSGVLRDLDPDHTVQTLIGATVYHFASGEFGRGLLGGSLFTAEAVRRRKQAVKALVHGGLVPHDTGAAPGGAR